MQALTHMNNMLLDWLALHWVFVVGVLAYFIASVAPRPPADQLVGWKRVAFVALDYVCCLTADSFPGKLKVPGRATPPPPATTQPQTGVQQ